MLVMMKGEDGDLDERVCHPPTARAVLQGLDVIGGNHYAVSAAIGIRR